jgi:hypothetical protein
MSLVIEASLLPDRSAHKRRVVSQQIPYRRRGQASVPGSIKQDRRSKRAVRQHQHLAVTAALLGVRQRLLDTFLSREAGRPIRGAPANLLGGLGSGIAYASGNTFLALPDRGPNAVAFDAAIDSTASARRSDILPRQVS